VRFLLPSAVTLLTNSLSLVLSFILSIPVLGLTAHWTQGSQLNDVTYSFESMGLYISCLTLIVIPILYALFLSHRVLV
jgi:hypothetical protein